MIVLPGVTWFTMTSRHVSPEYPSTVLVVLAADGSAHDCACLAVSSILKNVIHYCIETYHHVHVCI